MANPLSDPYIRLAEKSFPRVQLSPSPLKPDTLLSDVTLEVKKSVLKKVEAFVRTVHAASRRPLYREKIHAHDADLYSTPAQNDSVLMAYDFHLSAAGEPRLIEINTNASGYLITALLYELRSIPAPMGPPLDFLRKSFFREWQASGRTEAPRVAIIDESLELQKMLAEFYMYQSLFESWGWPSVIDDYQNFFWQKGRLVDKKGGDVSFVYNRLNDFYLSRPQSKELREAYLSGQVIFSPQPRDYQLLADKQRLVEWSRPGFWDGLLEEPEAKSLIEEVLLKSHSRADFPDLEKLWGERKKYFFKPLRMYGGKSAFKGANISRVAFDRIFADDQSMAQEICPAPRIRDKNGAEWKYDLRFYVYRDEVHSAVGRIYQGQVTNFSSLGGGFCCLRFVD
jgi:hypothetical protein